MMDRLGSIACVLALGACNVPPPEGARGAGPLEAGPGRDAAADAGVCSRSVVVAESDYTSTNVALLGLGGDVLSPSIASSATRAVGLAAPLSGDVVLPTMPVVGSELVLVDSGQTTSSIVWVDPATAAKRSLSVATGFWSDPRDYAAVSSRKAYVSRYNTNSMSGQEPFDAGGDVLVVDPRQPAIVSSIDMAQALGADRAQARPDPDKIVVAGDRAYVLLGALPRDFSSPRTPSRLAVVDTTSDELADTLVLDGLFDCAGLALSPDERTIAVLCAGKMIDPNAPSDLGGSGVAIVDVTADPRLVQTFAAADLGTGPVGFFAAFSAKTSLVLQTFGFDDPASGKSADDTVVRLDLTSGATTVVLRSAGEPFTLGGIACDTACGACFVTDAKRMGGVVHRFALDASGGLSGDELIKAETDPGLPPRYVGLF